MKSIAVKAFTTLPGPRHESEGSHSGEEFRQKYLEPAFLEAQKANERLQVDLDGAEFGYPTSFLEEAFGGLARKHGTEAVLKTLSFVATDEPLLEEEIFQYIRNAHLTKPPQATR